MKVVCSVCEAIMTAGTGPTSHGICPVCNPLYFRSNFPETTAERCLVSEGDKAFSSKSSQAYVRYLTLAIGLLDAEFPVVPTPEGLLLPAHEAFRITQDEELREASSWIPSILIYLVGSVVYYGDRKLGSISEVLSRVSITR